MTFSSEQWIRALFMDPQISFFINFFIKNGSHGTIYTFKNYFATVISAISFQFQQNKFYPNRPIKAVWIELIFTEIENWNWKYCNEIIFKYINSIVRPIFNEKVTEKCNLRVCLWTVHKSTVHGRLGQQLQLGKKRKKGKRRKKKRERANAQSKHIGCVW